MSHTVIIPPDEINAMLTLVSLLDADEKVFGTDMYRWSDKARALILKYKYLRENP